MAFAAYRAALDQEESVAMMYRAVVGQLRRSLPSRHQVAAEECAAARHGSATESPATLAITTSQPINGDRSLAEELPAAGDQGLRVLIADQDGFARRMLERVLRDLGEVAMTTGARDGHEALALARQYRPQVLLVDISVPPAGGVELIRKVVPILPRARIVTVSAVADRDHAVLAAFQAGAIGHIDKETAADQIARLVNLAARGEPIVPTRLMPRLLARWRVPPPAAGDHPAS